MRVVVFSPTRFSLYSRLVTHLARAEQGIEVVGIVERSIWNPARFRSELRRDGSRLLRKIYRKFILRDRGYQVSPNENLSALSRSVELPPGNLKQLAKAWGVPHIRVSDLNDKAAEEFLGQVEPDVVAFTGGGLVRKNILKIPRIGVLNCHMGILPRYRGMDVVEWPVAEEHLGEEGIGLTLHLMETGVDTGPILLQSRCDLLPGDVFETIRARLEPMMVRLMIEGLKGLRDGSIRPSPQRLEDGRQYFVMHPRILDFARRKLEEFQVR
ncbi:MAG: hypothetical protein HUU16_07780 [Candidatus Omnitrophica bacterium]|nr:Methionyl-tRNA formyltransferase [bacterium]NUN96060.1 hypothetical protein [Candidatus Omnitrophota bacterium]